MKILRASLVVAWILGAGLALGAVWNYKSTPGPQGVSPPRWPSASDISFSGSTPTLVIFLHPRCPCARASLEELATILTAAPGKASVQIVFFSPGSETQDWGKTDVWNSATRFPGACVRFDRDGAEARRFHAPTSGHAFLYDADGGLRFSGGITGARGHQGENPGRQALIDLMQTGVSRIDSAPVFGCPIFSEDVP